MARKAKQPKAPKDASTRRAPKAEALAKPVKENRPRGRQTIYTREIADRICQELSEGRTLNQICRADDMPSRPTVLNWAREDRDAFSDRYAQAREMLVDHWADEAVDIADDGSNDFVEREAKNGTKVIFARDHVERSKLRVDTRKWMLSRLNPQRYGDRVEQTHKADAAFVDLLRLISQKS